jgi:hypothetical protein
MPLQAADAGARVQRRHLSFVYADAIAAAGAGAEQHRTTARQQQRCDCEAGGSAARWRPERCGSFDAGRPFPFVSSARDPICSGRWPDPRPISFFNPSTHPNTVFQSFGAIPAPVKMRSCRFKIVTVSACDPPPEIHIAPALADRQYLPSPA